MSVPFEARIKVGMKTGRTAAGPQLFGVALRRQWKSHHVKSVARQ